MEDIRRRLKLVEMAMLVQFVVLGLLSWGYIEINRHSKDTLATVIRNQDELSDIAESGRAQSEFNEQLSKAIKLFNEGHAGAAFLSFGAAAEQRKCLAGILLKKYEDRSMADIDKCDRVATPPPASPPTPPEPPVTKEHRR